MAVSLIFYQVSIELLVIVIGLLSHEPHSQMLIVTYMPDIF